MGIDSQNYSPLAAADDADTYDEADSAAPDLSEIYSGGALSEAQRAAAQKTSAGLYASADAENKQVLSEQQKIANSAREALRNTRLRLTNEKPDRSAMWLAVSEALGAPVHAGGGAAASFANAAGTAARYRNQEDLDKRGREADVDKLNEQLANYGDESDATSPDIIQSRLTDARLKQLAANRIDVALLRKGQGAAAAAGQTELSKLIALRDGLPKDDPNRRLYDAKIKLLTTREPNANMIWTSAANANPRIASLMATLSEKQVSLGPGYKGAAQQLAAINGLLQKHPDLTDEQIAEGIKTNKIAITGDMAAARSVGTTVGKVAYADQELEAAIPLARASSGKLPRNMWVTPQKILQMSQAQLQNPALRDFQIKVRSLQNAYEMLAARSGNDVGKRAELHQMAMTADSPAVFEAALKAMDQEGKTARKAGHAAMRDVATGGADDAAAAPAADAGVPNVPMSKDKGGQTWTLHKDGRGRWAYVSPDRKQYELVKP